MRSPTRWITTANTILGLWLIVAPFVFGMPLVDRWNDVTVGTIIVIFTGYNHYCEWNQGTISRRVAGANGVLGGWLIVAPFVYGISGFPLWNNVSVGILVTAFAGYNVYAAPRTQRTIPGSPSEDV